MSKGEGFVHLLYVVDVFLAQTDDIYVILGII